MTSAPEDPGVEPRGRRVGLDAGTGRVLWTTRDTGGGFPVGVSFEVVAGGGVVPGEA
jgi:hypothetical protein